jgi:hypothetical protein
VIFIWRSSTTDYSMRQAESCMLQLDRTTLFQCLHFGLLK